MEVEKTDISLQSLPNGYQSQNFPNGMRRQDNDSEMKYEGRFDNDNYEETQQDPNGFFADAKSAVKFKLQI